MENKIEEVKKILSWVWVTKVNDNEYKPIKNTSKQDVYKTVYELRQLLNMTNYEMNCLNEKENESVKNKG